MEWTIYNNTTPWGLLTDEQRAKIKEHNGAFVFWDGSPGYWCNVETSKWLYGFVYRAVKPEPQPAQVKDWSVLADDIVAVAWDDDGIPMGYNFIPELVNDVQTYWGWPEWSGAEGFPLIGLSPKILIRGDVPWHETLCIRPGYEEKADE